MTTLEEGGRRSVEGNVTEAERLIALALSEDEEGPGRKEFGRQAYLCLMRAHKHKDSYDEATKARVHKAATTLLHDVFKEPWPVDRENAPEG